ncbi:MAG TPA: isoprenylcysteine carboxylmethyltransferase family protein [Caulobacteraceae bacterium]|jgi:protein-S-isoprenylcysteine O-methyltransferase Ste14
MLRRVLIQSVIWFALQAVILLGAADDWGWPQGWTYLGEVLALSSATTIGLMVTDPELLKARLTSPFQRNQRPRDLVIIIVFFSLYVGWFVLIGLDHRFLWSGTPLLVQILGAVLIGVGMMLVWETFRANTFATTQVRVQTERAQTVVDSGPYRYIRHPMYAGMVLFVIGTALMLGSLWGLAATPVLFVMLAMRTLGEEKVLKQDLAGYADYVTKTPWRIVPGVW